MYVMPKITIVIVYSPSPNLQVIPQASESSWTEILPRSSLGPHRQHYFQLANVTGKVFTHVRMTIYPDGGVKRIRVIGRPAEKGNLVTDGEGEVVKGALENVEEGASTVTQSDGNVKDTDKSILRPIPALPLTPEAFLPFGRVIQSFSTPHAAPAGIKVTGANQDSAQKFHKLALLESAYSMDGAAATSGVSTYRCKPLQYDVGEAADKGWEVKLLERHPYTTQVFVPMGAGSAQDPEGIQQPGNRYLVVVALNKSEADDSPNLDSLRAFVAHGGQSIMYGKGVWRTSDILR